MPDLEDSLDRAASAVASASALLITAGAGMGVDSGLPDFRGPEGFWKAYPPFRKLRLDFASAANPRWFLQDPALAWGFYGHRLNLYRSVVPHAGFEILWRWADRLRSGAFIFTSNVDGHFFRAGFAADRVAEVHGSIHHAQCMNRCGAGIFSAASFQVAVNETSFRCEGEFPRCPSCGGLARPNILMFGDADWDSSRSAQQQDALDSWLDALGPDLVIVELGAGTSIPTVRNCSETIAAHMNATLVRINLREPECEPASIFGLPVPALQSAIGLPMGALAALQAIDQRL